jgi:hypothetical protein
MQVSRSIRVDQINNWERAELGVDRLSGKCFADQTGVIPIL